MKQIILQTNAETSQRIGKLAAIFGENTSQGLGTSLASGENTSQGLGTPPDTGENKFICLEHLPILARTNSYVWNTSRYWREQI
jgi:hypothetical protein